MESILEPLAASVVLRRKMAGVTPTGTDPSLWSGGVPPFLFLLAQDPPRFFGADVVFHSPVIPKSCGVESTLEPLVVQAEDGQKLFI